MPSLPESDNRRRLSEFDGLRGVAIALVVWHHLVVGHLPQDRASLLGWLRALTTLSWCGVDLFFVLSGFFIGGILLDHRTSPVLTKVFYRRRAARILPLYFVTLAAAFTATWAHWPDSYHRFSPWVYCLFLTNFAIAWIQNWDWAPLSVLWTLGVEEQFYLAAPWVVRATTPARLPWLIGGLAVLAWIGRVAALLFYRHGNFAIHVLMPLRMDALALGALVAWAIRHEAARPFFRRLGSHWVSWLALAFVALVGLAFLRPGQGSPALCIGGYTLLAVVFALVVAIVAAVRPPSLNRLLAVAPLAHLGRHSYFVYLWHMLIGAGLIRLLGGAGFVLNSFSSLGIVIIAVGATWGAATFSWRYFEGPLVAWGHRLPY